MNKTWRHLLSSHIQLAWHNTEIYTSLLYTYTNQQKVAFQIKWVLNPVFETLNHASDICGADVCVVILLLSSSKAFMLSASKPPANCRRPRNQLLIRNHLWSNWVLNIGLRFLPDELGKRTSHLGEAKIPYWALSRCLAMHQVLKKPSSCTCLRAGQMLIWSTPTYKIKFELVLMHNLSKNIFTLIRKLDMHIFF